MVTHMPRATHTWRSKTVEGKGRREEGGGRREERDEA
jgi:hypothetical protein